MLGRSLQRNLCQPRHHGNRRQPALGSVAVTAAFAMGIGKWGGHPAAHPPHCHLASRIYPPTTLRPCSKHCAGLHALGAAEA